LWNKYYSLISEWYSCKDLTAYSLPCRSSIPFEDASAADVVVMYGILNFIAVGFYFNSITILTGIAIGLSAAGLFDQTKLLKK